MERRYILFMVLVVLILTGQFALRAWLQGRANPQGAAKQEAKEDGNKEKGDAKKPAAQPKEEDKSKEPQGPAESPKPPAVAAAKPAAKTDRKWVTLGSLDPSSGYRMLVTLDSQGAGVVSVELGGEARRQYFDVDATHGYLGYLAAEEVEGGLKVNAVGSGTPAFLAKEKNGKVSGGLAIGDVITSLDGAALSTLDDLIRTIKRTSPGQAIEVAVTRQVGGKPAALTFAAKLSRQPLEIIRQERRRHEDGVELDPASFLLTLEHLGERILRPGEQEIAGLNLHHGTWELTKATADMAEFQYVIHDETLAALGQKGPIRIVKRFTLARQAAGNIGMERPYSLLLQIEVHNQGQEREVAYQLAGPNGLPLEGWWYTTKLHPRIFYTAGARDVVWRQPDQGQQLLGCRELYDAAMAANEEKKTIEKPLLTSNNPEPLEYVGVDTQFFSAVMKPQPTEKGLPLFKRADADVVQDVTKLKKDYSRTTNVSVQLVNDPVRLAPGGVLAHDYEIFLGPKDEVVLAAYNLTALIEKGWRIFAGPAWLLGGILHALYSAAGNYGIAIILLTVIVRACMLPLSIRQAKSAAKMQELAPEMARIKEKYANDMERQGMAMRELYAKHNFNPFGGCLLVFIQLPIFIGLYRCLSVDINLRDAPLIPGFWWASNLAGPDRLFYWKDWLFAVLADETGWLGPYCNVLPVITCALFIIQQKLFTPPATDEQMEMQQKMMMYMTIFMGVMFFKVPAGLCIYFITSSLWSIVERKLLPKAKPAADAGRETAKAAAAKPSTNGSPPKAGAPKSRRK